jgi:hypothetical protein
MAGVKIKNPRDNRQQAILTTAQRNSLQTIEPYRFC